MVTAVCSVDFLGDRVRFAVVEVVLVSSDDGDLMLRALLELDGALRMIPGGNCDM